MFRAAFRRNRASVKFALAFAGYLAALALIFEVLDGAFARFYLKPTCIATSFLLEFLGVEAEIRFENLSDGFCDFLFGKEAYRITYSCTGIFTCLIFVAGVLAYPSSASQKLRGLAVGIPAFLLFGIARLTLMGFIAAVEPDYISPFHRYIMVMVGAGVALFLWMWWVEKVAKLERPCSIPV